MYSRLGAIFSLAFLALFILALYSVYGPGSRGELDGVALIPFTLPWLLLWPSGKGDIPLFACVLSGLVNAAILYLFFLCMEKLYASKGQGTVSIPLSVPKKPRRTWLTLNLIFWPLFTLALARPFAALITTSLDMFLVVAAVTVLFIGGGTWSSGIKKMIPGIIALPALVFSPLFLLLGYIIMYLAYKSEKASNV